ncbi:MAG: tocopherol cyclase family protein [Crocinitomicaceae bacterium]
MLRKKTLICLITVLLCGTVIETAHAQVPSEVNFQEHPNVPGYKKLKKNNPHVFQGNKKKKKYFEGWYFKMVSEDGSSIMSVIPGISLSEDGSEQHAFIQFIDGKTAKTDYYSFPIEDFYFSSSAFAVRIGENYFSEDSLILNIQNDSTSISGKVFMSNLTYLSEKRKKGIMGWYRSVPFMQCYHGVVSLDHTLNGQITTDEGRYDFNDGVGYIEKDWGKSMPSSWIWIQSNSFQSNNSSFMLSVANIPWLGSSFNGFLGFYLHNDTIHRFATYTKAKVDVSSTQSDTLNITISDKSFTYVIQAFRSNSGELIAPVQGSMERRISESVDAEVRITVMDKDGKTIHNDRTRISGLEIVGDVESLRKKN